MKGLRKTKVYFYVKTLENIESEENLEIKLNKLDCLFNDKDFVIKPTILDKKIIIKEKLNDYILLEAKFKTGIQAITQSAANKIIVESIDMNIYYNKKIIIWEKALIENSYWYKFYKEE